MNRNQLQRHLEALGLREDAVSFTAELGAGTEQYCIGLREDGLWEVYYSERGQKGGLVTFGSEGEACAHLSAILKIDSSVWK